MQQKTYLSLHDTLGASLNGSSSTPHLSHPRPSFQDFLRTMRRLTPSRLHPSAEEAFTSRVKSPSYEPDSATSKGCYRTTGGSFPPSEGLQRRFGVGSSLLSSPSTQKDSRNRNC